MGREIRRVPSDWRHPKDGKGYYVPLYDVTFMTVAEEWVEQFAAWERGEDKNRARCEAQKGRRVFFWEWDTNPPNFVEIGSVPSMLVENFPSGAAKIYQDIESAGKK